MKNKHEHMICKLCGGYDLALRNEDQYSEGCRIVICQGCAKRLREKYIEEAQNENQPKTTNDIII